MVKRVTPAEIQKLHAFVQGINVGDGGITYSGYICAATGFYIVRGMDGHRGQEVVCTGITLTHVHMAVARIEEKLRPRRD